MKKVVAFILSLVILVFCSCSNDKTDTQDNNNENTNQSQATQLLTLPFSSNDIFNPYKAKTKENGLNNKYTSYYY